MSRFRKKSLNWIINQKIKLILAVILGIVAIFLWGRILLLSSSNKTTTIRKGDFNEKVYNQIREVDQIKKREESNLYQVQNTKRESPFTKSRKGQLEFSYKNSLKDNEDSICKLNSTNSPFTLIGITREGQSSLAIIKAKGKIYFLKVGEGIEDFRVKRIDNQNIILVQDNIDYELDIIKYRFSNK